MSVMTPPPDSRCDAGWVPGPDPGSRLADDASGTGKDALSAIACYSLLSLAISGAFGG